MTPAFTPAPSAISIADATAALAASAATWQVALDGTAVTFAMSPATATAAAHTNDGVNTVRWALEPTDPDIEPGVLGLTFLSYRTGDGVALDADVVMNATDFTWVTMTTSCAKEYDLQSALTHELCHALGLAHAIGHPDATMYATGQACDTGKRSIEADDRAGIDSLYRTAATAPAPGGCSTGSPSGLAMLPIVAALGLVLRRRRALAAGLVAASLTVPASAAQLRRLPLEELGRDAAMVVRGHVIAEAPARDGAFETEATLVVDECLAGTCPATTVVRRRGGEHDGIGLWVDAEAPLAVGQDVVVYLRRDVAGRLRVLGGVQGLWQLVTPAGSTAAIAVRDLRGQHIRVDDAWVDGELEGIRLDDLRTRTRTARSR
jgi:MYXO-CTERM domain-containing protein